MVPDEERCIELIHRCRNRDCDRQFKYEEKMVDCPSCGENRRCQRRRHFPFKRCFRHSKRGIPKPSGGSRYQINRLAAGYLQIQNDPELLSHRESLELLDFRINQLIERAAEMDASDKRWKDVIERWNKLKRRVFGTLGETSEYREFVRIMDAHEHDYEIWNQITQLILARARVGDAEVKRIEKMQQMLTAEDAMQFAAQLLAANVKVLEDHPKLLRDVNLQFIRIVGDAGHGDFPAAAQEERTVESSFVDDGELLDTGSELPDRGAGSAPD
jgi:hypothetical protein